MRKRIRCSVSMCLPTLLLFLSFASPVRADSFPESPPCPTYFAHIADSFLDLDSLFDFQNKWLEYPAIVLPPGSVAPAVCFGPDTPPDVVEARLAHVRDRFLQLSLYQFSDSDRWSSTTISGSNLQQGDSTVITWSIVPDGTSIPGYVDEPSGVSNLISTMDNLYGGSGESDIQLKPWFILFEQVFDRWSELTGNTYIYVDDDGDPWEIKITGPPFSPIVQAIIADGQTDIRGDVRIAGHYIDGNSGILAYNFFPESGDMIIDTADNFFDNTGSNSLRLRNVLAHEHGHGLGLSHVCPVNQTKLMEPYATTAFDGPQLDDILAGQRGYGDQFETNDTIAAATDLGSPTPGFSQMIDNVSIDGSSDTDVYQVTVSDLSDLSVTVTPIGSTYHSGPQNSDGSCTAGTSFNALTQNNLGFEILGLDQSTILASANVNGPGIAESISDLPLSDGAGTYYLRVFGNANAVQLYELQYQIDLNCTGPQILDQPLGQTVCAGSNVMLSVFAEGDAPLTIQWQKDDFDIDGATDPNFVLSPAEAADSGIYRAVVTNACDSVASSDATVTIVDIAADQDQDCDVDPVDLVLLLDVWLEDCTQVDCGRADQDGDQVITLTDFALFSQLWLFSL